MDSLIISLQHWLEMRDHVQRWAPEEACGFVAGIGHEIRRVYPITNDVHSPVRYRMDGQEQVAAFIDMEKHNWELLAIYHSHPQGPGEPSHTDLKERTYPGCLYLIWFPMEDAWHCRAFSMEDQSVWEVEIILGRSPKWH